MKEATKVAERWRDVLLFLKSHYPVYHASNVFFRDLQFGVQKYCARHGARVDNATAERLAHELAAKLEAEKVFRKLDTQTWVVDFPEYRKPQSKPAAAAPAAKPAPAAPAAKPAPAAAAPPAAPGGASGA